MRVFSGVFPPERSASAFGPESEAGRASPRGGWGERGREEPRAPGWGGEDRRSARAGGGRPAEEGRFAAYLDRLREEASEGPRLRSGGASGALAQEARAADVAASGPRFAAPSEGRAAGGSASEAAPSADSLAAHVRRLREGLQAGGASAAGAQAGPRLDPSRWAAKTYAAPPQPQPAAQEAEDSPLRLIETLLAPLLGVKKALLGGLRFFGGGREAAAPARGNERGADDDQRQGREMRREAGQILEPAPTHQLNT